MQQSPPKLATIAGATLNNPSLYEPLPFMLVRAPLLPIETWLAEFEESGGKSDHRQQSSLLPVDPRVHWALAVGSIALLDDLERSSPLSKDAVRLRGKLLRFLIRMSTRPTPYGLFAGVALGEWGKHTTLMLSSEPPRLRTRPDMAWLLALVQSLEANPDVRKQLRFVANTAAFIRDDRICLAERLLLEERGGAVPVSIRATGVVKRALSLTREPIAFQDLADALLASTPGATREKVENLLTELWQQTFLLTDLRPPLITDSPVNHVLQRLEAIPTTSETLNQIKEVVDAAAKYDLLPPTEGVTAYRKLIAKANNVIQTSEPPVQVDMAIGLRGQQISEIVGREIARAAELLLRMTPLPAGPAYLDAYRKAFLSRYGLNCEVPLLTLLDPESGLGVPFTYRGGAGGISQSKAKLRAQTLLKLAFNALQDHKQIIELDEATLTQLETWSPSPETAPTSLDLYAFVAASSKEAIDEGQFQVIIGPNIGAHGAGRNIGRFADLLGLPAKNALELSARAEERDTPHTLWAELAYSPRKRRSTNVVIRPAVRSHAIVVGASPGTAIDKVIHLDELVVGVRDNHFYVRSPVCDADIVVSTGHMLNYIQAPDVCRFLVEVSKDGIAQLSAFDWGPASNFPFLPRVQVGRVILRQAEWHIDTFIRTQELSSVEPERFQLALQQWRGRWRVPQYVYLSLGDNRLLLDLESAGQIEELRTEIAHLHDGGLIVLQEVVPELDQVWLQGSEGHYMLELVASLKLQGTLSTGRKIVKKEQTAQKSDTIQKTTFTSSSIAVATGSSITPADRLRPPGSDWLFVKLYCKESALESLLAPAIFNFAEEVRTSGMAEEWFFLRYRDPDLHIRLRFRGDSESLMHQLLPLLCGWATDLMNEGSCLRFVFDIYEREIERYGGKMGMQIAESIFFIDSRTVANCLSLLNSRLLQFDRINLAVLSIDHLLEGFRLTETERLQLLKQHMSSRNEVGQEYRQRKTVLRALLHDQDYLRDISGGDALMQAQKVQQTMLAPLAKQLQELAHRGELSQTPDDLYASFVHMNCNRLLGSDRSVERRVLGLLLRTREGLKASGQ